MLLLYGYNTYSSISNDEIAGARPDMNIKVAAYVKAQLWHNTKQGRKRQDLSF